MSDYVLEEIKAIAIKYGIDKLVLFGSRARGDNSPRSDYDIAVFGAQLTVKDRALFSSEIEEINTLKKIDIIFIDDDIEEALSENIIKEERVIYDKTKE